MDNVEKLFEEIAANETGETVESENENAEIAEMLTALADRLDTIIALLTPDKTEPANEPAEKTEEDE